jgi:hypothetical protein
MAQADNKWTTLARWVGLAGPIVAITLFFAGGQSKALSVETVSRATVADLTDPALSALKLTYQDAPVNQVTTVTLELANTGTRPIERVDFERPLAVHFADQKCLLAVTVGEKDPPNLDPQLVHDLSSATIAPMLLNPGDRFRLTLHLRGPFSEPTVDARISGIEHVTRGELHDYSFRQTVVLFVVGVLLLGCYGYLGTHFSLKPSMAIVAGPGGLFISILLAVAGVLSVSPGIEWLFGPRYYGLRPVLGVLLVVLVGVVLGHRSDRRIRARYQITRIAGPESKPNQP